VTDVECTSLLDRPALIAAPRQAASAPAFEFVAAPDAYVAAYEECP